MLVAAAMQQAADHNILNVRGLISGLLVRAHIGPVQDSSNSDGRALERGLLKANNGQNCYTANSDCFGLAHAPLC